MPRSNKRQQARFGRQNNPSQSSGNRGGFEETGSGYRYDDQRSRFGNQQYQGRSGGSDWGQEGSRGRPQERSYGGGQEYGRGYGQDYDRDSRGQGYERSMGIGGSDWSRGYPESYRESSGSRDRERWNREDQWRYGRGSEGSGYGSEEYGEGMEDEFGYDSPSYSGSGPEWSNRSQQGRFGRREHSGSQQGYSGRFGQSRGGMSQGQFAGRGPQGYKRSDERITEDINEELTQHSEIDATNISVEVQNGEVTLKGTVNDRETKRRAEDVAESCSGVKQVQNQLRVKREDESESSESKRGTEDKRSHRQQIAS